MTGLTDTQAARWQDMRLVGSADSGAQGWIEAATLVLGGQGMQMLDAVLPVATVSCATLPDAPSSLLATDVAFWADPDALGSASVWHERIDVQELDLSLRRIAAGNGSGCLVVGRLGLKRVSVLAADGSRLTLDDALLTISLPVNTDAAAAISARFANLRLYGQFGTRVAEIAQGSAGLYASRRAVEASAVAGLGGLSSGKTVLRADLAGIAPVAGRDGRGAIRLFLAADAGELRLDAAVDLPGLVQIATDLALHLPAPAGGAQALGARQALQSMTVRRAHVALHDQGLTAGLKEMGLPGLADLALTYGRALADTAPIAVRAVFLRLADAVSAYLQRAEAAPVTATFHPPSPAPLLALLGAMLAGRPSEAAGTTDRAP